jgi:anti-sigma factor RsiW
MRSLPKINFRRVGIICRQSRIPPCKSSDAGFRFAEERPVNVFYWIDGKFGHALSAGTDKATLARIATAVYTQLEKPVS